MGSAITSGWGPKHFPLHLAIAVKLFGIPIRRVWENWLIHGSKSGPLTLLQLHAHTMKKENKNSTPLFDAATKIKKTKIKLIKLIEIIMKLFI